MFKKIMFSIVAFAIGAMVSVSIQACADDYDGISSSGSSNSSSNGSSSGSSNAHSAWCNNGMGSYTIYNAQGQVSIDCKNTFNSKGWIEKSIIIGYNNGNIKSYEQVVTYTYSSSGDTRYGTTVSTYYNESGQVIQTQRTTDEYRLHK